MNNGLVLLVAWLQWVAIVVALVVFVVRDVAGTHDDTGTLYERSGGGTAAGLPANDPGYAEPEPPGGG